MCWWPKTRVSFVSETIQREKDPSGVSSERNRFCWRGISICGSLLFTVTGFILKYQWAAVWSVAGQLDEELLGTGQGRDRYSNTETNASLRSPVREGADWEGSSGVLTPPMALAKSRLPSLFGSLVKERASSSFIRLHLLTTPHLLILQDFSTFQIQTKT